MRKTPKTAVLLITLSALVFLSLSETLAVSATALEGEARAYKLSAAAAEVPVILTASGIQGTADFTVSDYKSLVETVSSQYVARVPSFTVRYNASAGDIDAAGKTVLSDAVLYDDPGTTSDFDYLKWNMDRYQYRATIYKSSSSAYVIYTFSQIYRTTAMEEAFVNASVAEILKGLNVGSADAYAKVKAVHDYIVSHVDYDYTYTRYTAYDALSSGKAVCQGYSLLTYKMLLELGVPVRIVTGKANGGDHGWNIVKLGQYWYNLDVTWDDTAGQPSRWFLKSDAAFSDHRRDGEFAADAFYTEYPTAPADYDPSGDADTGPTVWAKDGVDALTARGLVPAALRSRYQSGITRAEFTAIITNVYEYVIGPCAPNGSVPFTDISDSPYTLQIMKGYTLGIIGGTGGSSFSPEGTLTREQCAKIISAAAGAINGTQAILSTELAFTDTDAISGWARPYVGYAFENGLMTGTGVNFEPQTVLTREQAMVIAERMIEKYGW